MLIEFGELNSKLLIPLLFPFFLKFRRLNRRNHDINSTAFTEFSNFISIIPCIILYIIQKIKSKSEKDEQRKRTESFKDLSLYTLDENEINKQNTYQIIEDKERKSRMIPQKEKIKQFLFISLISFLQLSASTTKILYYRDINKALKTNIQPLFQLLFLISLCVIFLGYSIYLHQIISVIIICTCLIIFFIESIIYQDIPIKPVIKTMAFYFFLQGFYILSNVLGKKYLNKYVENFYLFLFKYCIIALIPMALYGGLTYLLNMDNDNYKIFQYYPKIKVSIFLVDLFFSFFYEMGLWLTIYFFNPCYYFIFETIADFLELFLAKFDKTSIKYATGQLITFFILYPIILFSICVFNEIIILNFWGLSHNTKKKIIERERKDVEDEDNSVTMIEIGEDNDKGDNGGYIFTL